MSMVVISITTSNMPMHTKDDFEEWVKFNVGHSGRISNKNPLADYPIEAIVREVSHWEEPKEQNG